MSVAADEVSRGCTPKVTGTGVTASAFNQPLPVTSRLETWSRRTELELSLPAYGAGVLPLDDNGTRTVRCEFA
jgi:hypothetical protein